MSLNPTRLSQVLDRFEQVEARLGAASDGAEIVALRNSRTASATGFSSACANWGR